MRLLVLVFLLIACSPGKENTSKEEVILSIGDSISIGYREFLTLDLPIVSAGENCRGTKYTKEHIESWMNKYSNIRYILWNNGAWDILRHSIHHTSNTEYSNNLKDIIDIIKSKGIPIVFINTTYFPLDTDFMFDISRVNVINSIAQQVMNDNNIPIIDLYTTSVSIQDQYIATEPHFTKLGYKILAESIESQIKAKVFNR